jgi:polyisoprenoid-binding protein YceI
VNLKPDRRAVMATIPTGTYVIDPSHSEVSFSVRHAGVAKVRGQFRDFEGTVVVADSLEASSAQAAIVAASVETGDAKRDEHLRSRDFFAADERPTWTFTSNAVRPEGNDLVLEGDLTINGITRPVELDVEYNGSAVDAYGNERVGFSAETEINRKDFGLTWNVALEAGGFLVSDKAKIALEISAVKQA